MFPNYGKLMKRGMNTNELFVFALILISRFFFFLFFFFIANFLSGVTPATKFLETKIGTEIRF